MFRARRAGKMLSADELKTKLYSHLDKTGSINRMRIEIREKLISELLKKAAPVESVNVNNPVYTFDRTVLPLQISNWLIYDHLLRHGYQYALSIFVTEANFPTHPEKLLAACDILILLGLDSSSPEYKSITQMCSTSNTHSLLVAVIKCLFDLTTREGRCSELKDHQEAQSVVEQNLLVLDKSLDHESTKSAAPSTIPKQKKGSVDLNVHDQILLLKEEKEKEVQQLRHKLLQELDRLHSQERKQQLEVERFRNEIQSEREDLFIEKEKIRQKDLLMDKEYENKIEKKTRELEADFVSKIHAKEKQQEVLQQKLQEKEQKLNLLEMNLSNQKESYIALKKEMDDMKQLHTAVQTKYSNLLDENTNLLKKFESMSDYAVLKGDLETKSRELKNLQLEFEEYRKQSEKERESFRENLQKLDTKLRIKEPELLEAQRQVNLARDTLHMEEVVWQKERRKLEQEVMTSREMYQTLIQRIEEQKEDIQALHRTIHILHYQITDKNARNTASVEPLIPNRSSFRVTDSLSKQPDIFRLSRGTDDSPSKYRQKSLKFIEDAKDRITKLQQEANALQYKSSVVYGSAPKMTPHVTSNPSLFNFTSEQRFQPSTSHTVKPFVSELPGTNFENLIRNELPTLDLSFPAHIKSQLANAFTNVYKPGLSINPVPIENKTSHESDKSAKYSENMNKKSKSYFILQSGITSSAKNRENTSSEQFKDDSATNQLHFNVSHNSQVQPGESFLEESLLTNTRISPSVKDYQNINTGLFRDDKDTDQYDLHKSNDLQELPSGLSLEEFSESNARTPVDLPSNIQKKDNSETYPIQTGGDHNQLPENNAQSTHNPSKNSSQENSTPAHIRNLTAKLDEVYENNSKSPKQHENESQVPEPYFKNPTSSDQQASFEAPIVVDLDAAWKRKSSLKSLVSTPPHSKPVEEITSKETGTAQTNYNELQSKAGDLFESSSNKNNFPENYDVTDLTFGKEPQNLKHLKSQQKSNEDLPISENSDSSHGIIDKQKVAPQSESQLSNSGASKLPGFEFQVEKTKDPSNKVTSSDQQATINASISKTLDSGDVQKEVLSDSKPAHEDSLSELSEIHLSCGSEQEQQKEDSDNW